MEKGRKKVFVAMSGGVDSSVAAAILKEQGYDVVGITMCFSINYPNSKKPSCCGAQGISDAKNVALQLDIPHYVLDFADTLEKYVIDDFVKEYCNGRTPNPCVKCNQYLKFKILYDKVMGMGADFLATGHYAKIESVNGRKGHILRKAKDEDKDQSYFLYYIEKEKLPKILFPLGSLTKQEVRSLAKKFLLKIAEKQESQDICFVPETGYKQFITDHMGSGALKSGDFVNEKGEVVGQHKGIINYTIGQRDKLGIALGFPVYVYNIDKGSNTVYVGPKECLFSKGLIAKDVNLMASEINEENIEVGVRIRYNAKEVKGLLCFLDNNHIKIDFQESQKAVTPGQSVVFYKGDVVLGGGVIKDPIK